MPRVATAEQQEVALHCIHVACMTGDLRAKRCRHLMRSRCHGSSSCGRMSHITPDWAQAGQVCRVQRNLSWGLSNVPGTNCAHYRILHPILLVSGFRGHHGCSHCRQLCSAVMCVQGTTRPELDSERCARHLQCPHQHHSLHTNALRPFKITTCMKGASVSLTPPPEVQCQQALPRAMPLK